MSAYQAPKNGFRTFVIIWATQSVSVLGTALTVFAINIYVATQLYGRPEQKPQLAGALTLLTLAHFVPVMLMTPMAGAFADRHNRKQIMFWCDILSSIVSGLAVLMLLSGHAGLVPLLGFSVAYGVLDAFHGSAFDTAYAMLVSDRQLPRANAMMQTIWSLSTIVSPAVAAFLIGLPATAQQGAWGGVIGHALSAMSDGTPLAIGIDSVTFFLAAAILPFLYVPSPVRKDLGADGAPKRSMWEDIKEGAAYIRYRRPLLWLLATFAVFNMFAPLNVLLPLIVKFNLAPDWTALGKTYESAMAWTSTLISAGAVLGGALVLLWGGLKRRRIYGVTVPLVLGGLLQIWLGWSHGFYLSCGILFAAGLLGPVSNVHSQSIWQSQVPREMQGRVFSVRRVIAQCSSPIGLALAGWLAGRFDPGDVLAIMGVVITAFCLYQLFNRRLLKVEDKAYLDQLAAVND
jgi:MFS family permease